ncbi:MAG TPA: zinc ribbon domain-containing protein [Candidatus Limnocylindrales bacterium]|nr:zinc ribbon domain-containing protein [Candidatus Limnocylindrales bacterium]
MPLYDYDCAACGSRFEVIHGVHADPPTSCPLCGSGPVRKAFAAPAVHFKGSGWAKKERRAGSRTAAGTGTSGEGGGEGSGGDGASSDEVGAGAPAASGDGAGDSSRSTTGSTSKPTDSASASSSAKAAKPSVD